MCPDDPTHSRRDIFRPAALLGAAGTLPLLSSLRARAAAESGAPVRIGYLPITDATPLLVVHANSLFEAEDIQTERSVLLHNWVQVVEASISSQVNVIHLLSSTTVWARYGSKVPARVVAWNHVDGPGSTVAPEVAEVHQLDGKSVAIPFWYSIHSVVLQQLLRDNGLRAVSRAVDAALAADEVNPAVLPSSDMPSALASKRIRGYIVAEPFNALAENLKVGRTQHFTDGVWRNHACCVVFMHEHDLKRRPRWSQKVINAIVGTQLWTRGHRVEAAQLSSKVGANRYTSHVPKILGRVLAPGAEEQQAYLASGAIRRADWQGWRIDFQPYPYPDYTEELARRLKDTLIKGSNAFLTSLGPRRVASDLMDNRFVHQALTEISRLQAFGLAEGFQRSEEVNL